MAVFSALHDVAQVLAEHVIEQLGITDVQPGPPRETSASPNAGVRVTLLYTTPQPGHRNDAWERSADGTSVPPPVSLSCFYLVTTSGADADDPIAAHNALGQVLQLFHDQPVLSLPLTQSVGGAGYTELGDGRITVVQAPMVLDQIDKIWTSLEAQLQPWVLFEVGPVQLASLRAVAGPAPLVRPGGFGAMDVRAGQRPIIERMTPDTVAAGGTVRIDAALAGTFEGLRMGGVWVPVTDGSLSVLGAGGAMVLTLDDGGLETLGEGSHSLTLVAGGVVSRRASLRVVVGDDVATLNAPAVLRHDPSTDLVLTGSHLAGAVEALVWPDGGIVSPSEVHTLVVGSVSDTSVTLPAIAAPMGLSDLGSSARPWRLAVRVGTHVYTPYVLLELGT